MTTNLPLKKILFSDLVAMDAYTGDFPVKIDLVYANADHPENIFGKIYRDGARLWTHRDLAPVILEASKRLFAEQGWFLCLKDSLRTIEAQALMQEAGIVKRNPHWMEEPNRLLSPPGAGAHPRAMAIDLVPVMADGTQVPMGTAFDHLSEDPDHNPAARDYKDLPPAILENRKALEDALNIAAREKNIPFMPLPSEWWDFRFPPEIYGAYAPLSDKDLPEDMRMTG